jgi:hypothetical protein
MKCWENYTHITVKQTLVLLLSMLLGGIISTAVLTSPVYSAINDQINFQGKLTNPDGTNVANGSYTLRFRIYTDPSADAANACAANSCQWEETKSVVVTDGIFRTSLGDTTSLGAVNFNNPTLYLAMKVSTDNEMTPRIRFTASPYAFNSSTLNGLNDGNFVKLAQGVQTDASSTNGSIAIDKTGAGQKVLDLRVNGANALSVNSDKSSLFNGRVTVDTSASPATVANTNGLNVNYSGGSAAVEGAGMRIDYTPGTTSGGTWSGMRIVSAATGAATGVTEYGLKIEGPSTPGAGDEVGIRVASGFDIGADIGSGGLQMTDMNDPATPAANTLRVYASTQAGRSLLKIKGQSGVATSLQPSIFTNKVGWWTAQGNSTTISAINIATNATGTATTRNVATTSLFTSVRRVGYVSAGLAGNSAGTRHGVNQFYAGDIAGRGGYYFVTRLGISGIATNMRSFIGLNDNTTAMPNANPSVDTNLLGFGCDTGETQFTFMHNSAAGAATKDTLTGAFPCRTASTDFYEMRIFTPPNSATTYYSIENMTTGAFYEGSTNTDLPTNTTLLNPHVWVNNGTTATAVGIDISSQYIETDN